MLQLLLPFLPNSNQIVYHPKQKHVMKITWILATWCPRLTCNHFSLQLGECALFCPSYLDPPMGTGVTRQPDLNRLIARNGQFFSLADQSNIGLKVFLASVPSCNRISAKAVHTWYMLFTKMAATIGFYLHPYFWFRKHANSDYGSCVALIRLLLLMFLLFLKFFINLKFRMLLPHSTLHIPANPATGQLEVLANAGSWYDDKWQEKFVLLRDPTMNNSKHLNPMLLLNAVNYQHWSQQLFETMIIFNNNQTRIAYLCGHLFGSLARVFVFLSSLTKRII